MSGSAQSVTTQPQQPNYGGQDHPYAFPYCTGFETLRRAAAFPNPNGERTLISTSLDVGTPLPEGYFDPSDVNAGDLKSFIGQNGLTGLCQGMLSISPPRYGLFWIMEAQNSFLSTENLQRPAGTNLVTDETTALRNVLPKKFGDCVASQDEIDASQKLIDSFYEKVNSLDDTLIDSFVALKADLTASNLIRSFDLNDMTEAEERMLQKTAGFALTYGIPEKEFLSIAGDVFSVSVDREEFLDRLMCIISLRIARIKNWEGRATGGISEDFEDYAKTLEEALMDGRVDIRVMNVAEKLQSPMAFAAYNQELNAIIFPHLEKEIPMTIVFMALLHELYHAYQDSKGASMFTIDAERQASAVGYKAAIALGGSSVVDYFSDGEAQSLEPLLDARRRSLRCMGIHAAAISAGERFLRDSMGAYRDYLQELSAGLPDLSFDLYYKGMNYYIMAASLKNHAIYAAMNSINAGNVPPSVPAYMYEPNFEKLREDMNSKAEGSAERAMAAYSFVNYFQQTFISAMSTAPDSMSDYWALQSSDDTHDIADALLDLPYAFDGI